MELQRERKGFKVFSQFPKSYSLISYRLFPIEQGLSFYKNQISRSMSTGSKVLILWCRNNLLNTLFNLNLINFRSFINSISQLIALNFPHYTTQQLQTHPKPIRNQTFHHYNPIIRTIQIFNTIKVYNKLLTKSMSTELNPQTHILARMQENFNKLSEQFQFVRDAVKFLENVLVEFPKTTFISFNGGKDATIVLVLTHLAIKNLRKQQPHSAILMPQGIYFTQPDPFPEMDQFYNQMVKLFKLTMHSRPTQKIPQQMTQFAQSNQVDCVIMGSRKDDWCGDIGLRAPSDTHKGYPSFLRINPVMYWQYHQIWPVIYALEIPYCKLYQEGYTSLGNMSNSVKNHSLLVGGNTYKHAAQAKAETQRDCRLSDKKKVEGENML